MENQVVQIALKDLVASSLNVRKVTADNADDKKLIASIRSQGVMQNLVVVPAARGKKFEVVAGGRRLAALNHLKDKKEITGDYLVWCNKKSREDATEASIAENVARADMHPADKFEAFVALAEGGKKSIKEIAKAFGETQAGVKRLLTLGVLAPEILDHFRKGSLDMDDVMAFTVCEDHDKQLACYEALAPHQLHAGNIRRFLVGQAVRSDDAMAKLVGLPAYKRAGGTVSADLFQDIVYLQDSELLERLAAEKLDKAAQEFLADGWKWVEVIHDSYVPYGRFAGRLQGEFGDVPVELTARLEAARKELEELENGEGDYSAEESQRVDDLYEQIEADEEKLEQYRAFTHEQKSQSGVAVFYNREGEILVELGHLKKEDMRQIRQQPDHGGESHGEGGVSVESGRESQALISDLANYRLQAMQAALLKAPGIVEDLSAFAVADQVLGGAGQWNMPVSVNAHQHSFDAPGDIGSTVAAGEIEAFKNKLDLHWLLNENMAARFTAYCQLTPKAKKDIATYVMAVSLRNASGEFARVVASLAEFNIGDYWKPTADNYYKRLTANSLTELAQEQLGSDWLEEHGGTKKGHLVGAIEAAEGMAGWLPESIQ